MTESYLRRRPCCIQSQHFKPQQNSRHADVYRSRWKLNGRIISNVNPLCTALIEDGKFGLYNILFE